MLFFSGTVIWNSGDFYVAFFSYNIIDRLIDRLKDDLNVIEILSKKLEDTDAKSRKLHSTYFALKRLLKIVNYFVSKHIQGDQI